MFERLRRWLRPNRGSPDDAVSLYQAFLASGGEATHTVVVRLDPSAMENADLEIRWDLEKALKTVYPDLAFYDDGYGFARHSDAMLLTYATRDPDRLIDAIVDLVTKNKVPGYEMAAAMMIAVAPRDASSSAAGAAPGQEFASHRVVYPPNAAGTPLPDWMTTGPARPIPPW